MYDRILVAVDYSEVSGRALIAARDLARLSSGEVWVVHVVERELAAKTGALIPNETLDHAREAVAGSVELLVKSGVKAHGVTGHTVFGYAAREIVNAAREYNADVIVMGSRGRGDLAGLVLGSTAHKVIHLADRPVLVVR